MAGWRTREVTRSNVMTVDVDDSRIWPPFEQVCRGLENTAEMQCLSVLEL